MSYNNSDGINRVKIKKGFIYYYINNNKPVSDNKLKRINKLKIPPAWINVWISSNPSSSIQATGIDSKGRKQYRYHEQHIKKAEKKKFLRLFDFIKSIPKLNMKMKIHFNKKHIYSKERVIVTMLYIIKAVHMRVGKECYAKTNKSYGITSLKKKHSSFIKDKIIFKFKGKSNKRLYYSINNKNIIKHIKILLKLSGEKLFQYIDGKNNVRRVTDTDLNKYIQKYMGKQFTCKDFRTYASNMYFVKSLLKETIKRNPKNKKSIKKNIKNAFNKTAFYLKHTKAISKKSYVMNFTTNMYENNPKYFIKRKYEDPTIVLLNILKLYKKKVLSI